MQLSACSVTTCEGREGGQREERRLSGLYTSGASVDLIVKTRHKGTCSFCPPPYTHTHTRLDTQCHCFEAGWHHVDGHVLKRHAQCLC